jgi:tRNA(Met) C34 N-acetyltransferase TmcA
MPSIPDTYAGGAMAVQSIPPFPQIPGVEFRLVPEHPGLAVSDDGILISCRTHGQQQPCYNASWKILKPWIRNKYLTIRLREHREAFNLRVHALVLRAFVGPRPEGYECCHNDGNVFNNRLDNLRYDTRKNNHADKKRHGTYQAGEKHNMVKLKELEVHEIRRLCTLGIKQDLIAHMFLVCQVTVSYIHLRKTWKHI